MIKTKRQEEAIEKRINLARERITSWRQTRKSRGDRIPADLWDEAVALAKEVGIQPIRRALGLQYTKLRELVDKPASKEREANSSRNEKFLELDIAPFFGTTTNLGPVVEVFSSDGARMKVQYSQGNELNLLGLIEAFRRGRG